MIAKQRILTDEMAAEIRALFPLSDHAGGHAAGAAYCERQTAVRAAGSRGGDCGNLELAPAVVQDTLSFYGMFKQDAPHGEVRAWVCRSISCALRGADDLLDHMCHQAKIKPGETTTNGKLTLEFAECLGACEYAPCMLAGDTLHKDLTAEKADKFLQEVSKG